MIIAALGSSFAAGPGIPPVVDRAARRSGANYPHLLAERLGGQLVDLTVSGATTATILTDRQRVGVRTLPPQLDGLPADADLVTITAGGNDLGYLGAMISAALATTFDSRALTIPLGGLFRDRIPVPTEEDVARTASGLSRVVAAVRTRAPGARILLVEYLTLIAPYTEPADGIPFSRQQLDAFATIQAALTDAYSRVDAELVPIGALSRDHALGSIEPWVNRFAGLRNLGSSFHPNAEGMRAVADEIARRLATS